MKRYTVLLAVLYLCTLLGAGTSASFRDDISMKKNVDDISIKVNSVDISEKKLTIQYVINNDSQQEIWICDRVDAQFANNSILFLAEEGPTLTIWKQLYSSGNAASDPKKSKYVCLQAGQKRKESLFVELPLRMSIRSIPVKPTQDIFFVKRLAINIGYFQGNLPEMYLKYLEERLKTYNENTEGRSAPWESLFYSSLHFINDNERLRQRNEEVIVYPRRKKFNSEKLLHTVIDNLSIPCLSKRTKGIYWDNNPPESLSNSTRIEIQYEPSILEYFFPYVSQQSLLNREEIEYLQSEKTIIVENQETLKDIDDEIQKGHPLTTTITDVIFGCTKRAKINCYRGNDILTSFTAYDNTLIETEQNKQFIYSLGLQSIRTLDPQIRELVYREQCTVNLKNLWYRLRFYNRLEAISKKDASLMNEKIYPEPIRWRDDMLQPYHFYPRSALKMSEKPYICPSAGEGKCHYAMNPNCEPNSPGDIVLLFETKAGWNQHGGPELFTFDNHDPKGGCVLLNDGTVKFIRTKDELHALRWKE